MRVNKMKKIKITANKILAIVFVAFLTANTGSVAYKLFDFDGR